MYMKNVNIKSGSRGIIGSGVIIPFEEDETNLMGYFIKTLSLFVIISLIGSGLFFTDSKADPPPWAPAHGYRYKHDDGVDLIFDSGLGLYIVVDFPNIHFSNDHFYRWNDDKWQRSTSFNGPWEIINSNQLPPGLQKDNEKRKGKEKKRVQVE